MKELGYLFSGILLFIAGMLVMAGLVLVVQFYAQKDGCLSVLVQSAAYMAEAAFSIKNL